MILTPESDTADRIRVLILDGDQRASLPVKLMLSKRGMLVESVSSGCEALQLLMRSDFDVILLDVQMQGMNGMAFLGEAVRLWPKLGVIIVTADADKALIEQARSLGVNQVLQKNVSDETLLASIQSQFDCCKTREMHGNLISMQKYQDQMRMLRQVTESVVASGNPTQAMRGLSRGIGQLAPCAAAGVLVLEDGDNAIFSVSAFSQVDNQFLEQMQAQTLKRCEDLGSGRPDQVVVDLFDENVNSNSNEIMSTVGSLLSVPVIGDHKIRAMISFATQDLDAYSNANVLFMYHVADHFSMVFATLEQMRQLAVRDSLTGLYNRLYVEEALEHAWERSCRYHQVVEVLILDLDHFKMVNDTYGHHVGDQVLQEFSRLMQEVVRKVDIVGRYGGEEFVIILLGNKHGDSVGLAERLMNRVRNHVFCKDTHPQRLTISIGISSSNNSNPKEINGASLLRQADHVLYVAKRRGRNQARTWEEHVRKREDVQSKVGETVAKKEPEVPVETGRECIMVVDDEPVIRMLLKQVLTRAGYDVVLCDSANEALELLRQNTKEIDIVLSDICMPGASGIELLQKLKNADDSIITIMMTGNPSLDNAIKCLRHGAYEFVEKPFEIERLLAIIRRALDYRGILLENQGYQLHLEDMVQLKNKRLNELLQETKNSYDFTLEALVAMLDAREHESGQHSQRVRELTLILARHMDFPEEDLDVIARGALLHDIGKIAIPDAILLKPAPLLPDEREIMQTHAEIGYNILQSSSWLTTAAEIVHSHQERYDGTGYPRGLKGDQIYLGARIFAVVDAFDAMRNERVYRKPLSPEETVAEIRRNSGTQFDPKVVEAFFECQAEMEECVSACAVGKTHESSPLLASKNE